MRVWVRLPFAALACAILAGCSKSTEAPGVAGILVSSSALTLASLNQTSQLTAAVLNTAGDTMTGQTITWTSSSTAIATVSPSGLVTSKANGMATVTATSGSVHSDVAVTVAQVPAVIAKTGDNQNGSVGQALIGPLTAHVIDALGSPVAGATVTFAVTLGGGNLGTPSGVTNATGDASTTWTLGTSVSSGQAVSATTGVLVTNYAATASAGLAAAVVIQAGNNQTGATGNTVTIKPSVKVTDSFGNPKSSISVLFQVTGGGGSVTGATQFTDAAGLATVGSWTLGSSAGTNTLSVTAQGTSAPVIAITASAIAPGAPANVAVFVGNNQNVLIGYKTNIRPAVRVTDANGLPVGGVSVTFGGVTGGGSLTTPTVNTNSQGIAQVGSWTVGAAAGGNSVTATATGSGITGNPVTFNANAASPAFNVTIQNIGPAFSAPVQVAFDSAVAFWQRVIYNDLVDIVNFTSPANQCTTGQPSIGPINVDDVLILAKFDSIDGPSNILGSAGPCLIRSGTDAPLTVMGTMRFDTADVANMIANGSLNAVIRHEMGHVLGFGTLWNQPPLACRANTAAVGNPTDVIFNCPKAVAAFDTIGGTTYTGGNKVPVENCGPSSPGSCGAGTINSHWREPTFANEMMTGYINAGANPASLITVAAMEDLGYTVNYAAAEVYVRAFTTSGADLRASTGPLISLGDDIRRGPLYLVDRFGRVVGTVQPR